MGLTELRGPSGWQSENIQRVRPGGCTLFNGFLSLLCSLLHRRSPTERFAGSLAPTLKRQVCCQVEGARKASAEFKFTSAHLLCLSALLCWQHEMGNNGGDASFWQPVHKPLTPQPLSWWGCRFSMAFSFKGAGLLTHYHPCDCCMCGFVKYTFEPIKNIRNENLTANKNLHDNTMCISGMTDVPLRPETRIPFLKLTFNRNICKQGNGLEAWQGQGCNM